MVKELEVKTVTRTMITYNPYFCKLRTIANIISEIKIKKIDEAICCAKESARQAFGGVSGRRRRQVIVEVETGEGVK